MCKCRRGSTLNCFALLRLVTEQYCQKSVGGTAFNPKLFGSGLGLAKAAANICLPWPLVTLGGHAAIIQSVGLRLGHVTGRKATARVSDVASVVVADSNVHLFSGCV